MLQKKDHPVTTSLHGFLVGVEIEDEGHATPETVALRLAESLTFVEDIGEVDVEHLGKIQKYEED